MDPAEESGGHTSPQAFRLLLIDSNPSSEVAIRHVAEDQGFVFRQVSDAAQGVTLAALGYDVLVIGLHLATGSGIDVCREIRRRRIWAPIVVLAENSTTTERVVLLEVGADDVIGRPYSERELAARLSVRWRRLLAASNPGPMVLHLPGLVIDEGKMETTRGGAVVRLSPTEMRVLLCLARHSPEAVTRETLIEEVWGARDHPMAPRSVDTHVSRVRSKVEAEASRPVYVHTLSGVGYCLDYRPLPIAAATGPIFGPNRGRAGSKDR
jgi:DNA-binding response OmpR family regulator